jgi:hypothetical protein
MIDTNKWFAGADQKITSSRCSPELQKYKHLSAVAMKVNFLFEKKIPLRPMSQFLEILKFTIPGLIVFATAYFLLKMYLDDRRRTDNLSLRAESQKLTLPLRLQAYERLILLCERVSLPNVLLRIRMSGMSAADLRGALLVAVSQEFEHNTAQQLYVSGTLWQIVSLAKQETINLIVSSFAGHEQDEVDTDYVDALFKRLDQQGELPTLQRAIVAIRTEVGQLF